MSELDRSRSLADDRTHAYSTSTNDTLRRLVLLAAPAGAAAAMWIHPHAGHDAFGSLAPVADRWLATHLLLFASLSLLAVGLYWLLSGARGRVASLGRLGVGAFALLHVGYVATVGIASGLVVREARSLPADQQAGVGAVVEYLLHEPALIAAGALGVVGYLVAVVAVAVVGRRAGAPLPPLALVLASVGAFAAHSGPVAIAGMASFAAGVAWLEAGWTPSSDAGAPN